MSGSGKLYEDAVKSLLRRSGIVVVSEATVSQPKSETAKELVEKAELKLLGRTVDDVAAEMEQGFAQRGGFEACKYLLKKIVTELRFSESKQQQARIAKLEDEVLELHKAGCDSYEE